MRAVRDKVSAVFACTIGGHDQPPPPARPAFSEAIEIARVLCILGMIYAHAWTGQNGGYLLLHSTGWQEIFRSVLVETVGRSSVPLLGMVSGWLVAGSALRRGYWQFIKVKARTILAPMLIWNAFALLLVGGAMWMGWNRGPRIVQTALDAIRSGEGTWKSWEVPFQELTSFTDPNHINFQTPFLRDLFVMMLLAPVLIRLRGWALGVLVVVVAGWSIADLWFPLIIRPQVALFFLIGLLARRKGVADRVLALPLWLIVPAFLLFAGLKLDFAIYDWWYAWKHKEIALAVEVGLRITAAMLMWRICCALVDRPVTGLIKRVEPYAFLLFCSHMIFIWLFAQHIGRWVGAIDTPFYPIFFLAHPFLLLAAAVGLGKLLLRTAPRLATLLSGGRLKTEENQRDLLTGRQSRSIAPAS